MIKYIFLTTGLALTATSLQLPSWAASMSANLTEVRKSNSEAEILFAQPYGGSSGTSGSDSSTSGSDSSTSGSDSSTSSPPTSCDPSDPSSCYGS